jgi:hypothetical protein
MGAADAQDRDGLGHRKRAATANRDERRGGSAARTRRNFEGQIRVKNLLRPDLRGSPRPVTWADK